MNKDLTLEIKANTKRAVKQIDELKKEIKSFKNSVDNSTKSLKTNKQSLSTVTSSLKNLALAFGAFEVIKGTVSAIANFESGLKKLEAISGASGQALKDMQDKARELGETTQYSASQVVEAMNYQAMAGMKSNEILTATKDILDLATVGNMDLARASDIATDSMSGFGLKAKDLHRVTDVMAVTITSANTNVEQLGEAFKQVAPLAHSLNLTIEQTSAMLGTLANAGLKGGIAGTHLKIILQRLSSTTADVQKGFKALGLSAYDSNGKLKPMGETLKAIKEKLKGLNEQQQADVFKKLFGREAISSAHILLDNLDGVDNLLKKVTDSSGKAGDMAKKMQDSLAGAWKELKSALEGLALTIGDDLLPALTDITRELVEITRSTTEFYKENKALIKTVLELVTALYGFSKVKAILTSVLGASALLEITSFAGGIAMLKKGFDALKIAIMGLSKANIILAALTAAMVGIDYALNRWQESIDELNKKVEVNNNLNKQWKDIIGDVLEHYDRQSKKMTLTIKQQEEYKKKIDGLIEAKKKYLKTLDPKEQKDLYKATKDSIRVLGLYKKKVDEATIVLKEKTKETKKAVEQEKRLSKEELNSIKDKYSQRVENHKLTLDKLYAKEKSIKSKIVALNEALKNKLKALDNERLHSKEDLASKIHGLEMVGASDIDRYRDKQLQADKLLSKAKIALKQGELAEYRRYKGEYESLVTSIASTEIKKDKQVLVSKKESANYGINALKKLGSLEDSYYAQSKAKAIALHNQKIAQLKAQLTATKAQIQLEVQRLQLEKQLIEAVTGKKVDIDVSGALKAIANIDNSIKELDKQVKKPKPIKIDNSQAVGSIEAVRQKFYTLKLGDKTFKITADTTPADLGIRKLITTQKGNHIDIKVNPEYAEAERKIKQAIASFERRPVKTKITADTKQANRDTSKLKKEIAKPTTTKVNADIKKAQRAIKKIHSEAKKPIKMSVKINATKAFNTIKKLKKNTSSTHTIYIREVKKKATGGLIDPIKLATGGNIEFERKQGRISGYDPSDSDDVPALLTKGEFVVKREAVKHYGDDLLYRLNNMQLPKFATGGLVTIGKPEKLIELISSLRKEPEYKEPEYKEPEYKEPEYKPEPPDTSFLDKYDKNNYDLSLNYDKNALKELAENLKKQYDDKVAPYFRYDLSIFESELVKIKNNGDKEDKNKDEIVKLIEELLKTKDKALKSKKPSSYTSKLDSLDSKINQKISKESEAYTNIDGDIDIQNNKLYDFENKLEEYKTQVEEFKDKIKSKFDDLELNPDDFLGRKFDDSFDLEKLKNYYYKLSNIRKTNIDKEQITSQYVSFMRQKAKVLHEDYIKKMNFGGSHMSDTVSSFELNRALHLPNGTVKSSVKIPDVYASNSQMANQSIIDKIYKSQMDRFKSSLPKFKSGGAIDGLSGGKLSGYGGGDKNLALLEDGEFILRKEAVSHFGSDTLNKLNNMQVSIPKFQTGGSVGSLASNNTNSSMDINFNLPNGNSYAMNSKVDVAQAFAQELKRMM